MSRVKVKICGITSSEDLILAVEAQADALGFVVDVPQSPRNLSRTQAKELINCVPIFVESVVVTVFRDIEQLVKIHEELHPDAIQIHNFSPISRTIRNRLHEARIIGALNVNSDTSLGTVLDSIDGLDAVLVDTYDSNGIGGTGRTHDWNISRLVREKVSPRPLILAGGLTSQNVKEAIGIVKPYAVDTSSGVESSPGRKDRDKVFSFVKNAKEVKL